MVRVPSSFSLSDNSLRKLASIMYDSVASLPPSQVAVTDIEDEQSRLNSIQVAASF